MDPRYSAQDVLRCYLCETPVPLEYCHIKLCKDCVGKHLSERSKEHKVVPFKQRGSTAKCPKHSEKVCELHCEPCNIPICTLCISSGEHDQHKTKDILKHLPVWKEVLRKDLQELENSISPQYKKNASKILAQKAEVRNHSQKLVTALKKQRDTLVKEIDSVIQKMQTKIDEMDSGYLAAIRNREDAINHTITAIKHSIADIKKMLDSDDVYFISAYKSRNDEFKSLPAELKVTLPNFTPQKINREQVYQQGELLKSVESKSGNRPWDIAVTQSGDLVYTDPKDRSVNIVKNKKIKTLITLQGWRPCHVCSTATGDLLVNMRSDDEKQTKVVRYSGSTKKQSIQWDDQGQPLYSSGHIKYLTENRNLEICVADYDACAVVVVSAAGKLRFRYTGHPSTHSFKSKFTPTGITTDSQGRIFTADLSSSIHILDQDGQFLCNIYATGLFPTGMCLDSKDNVFVATCTNDLINQVTKIQFNK